MNSRQFNVEHLLYILLFLVSLGIRLINLGSPLLTNYEAQWALQALSIARGVPELWGAQPLYINLTAGLFFLFGSNEILARLVPAILGSFVILPVFLMRDKLGRTPALLLSLFLAIDPTLVSASRQVTSLGMVIGLLLLVVALGFSRKPILFGVAVGTLLLTGTSLWSGLLILLIGWGLARFFLVEDQVNDSPLENSFSALMRAWEQFVLGEKKTILVSAGVTALLGGTAFFIIPAGFTPTFSSLILWLQSFAAPDLSLSRDVFSVFAALLVYEPLALFIGLCGTIGALIKRDKTGIFLSFLWAVALVFILVNPSRSANDLIWLVVPLWILGARFLDFIFNLVSPEEKIWTISFTGLSLSIMVFTCMAAVMLEIFMAVPTPPGGQNELLSRIAVVAGGVILLLAMTYLVGFGWSQRLAAGEMVFSISLLFLAITFSGSWNAAGLGKFPDREMFRMGATPTTGQLLVNTLDQISEWKTGASKLTDIYVINYDNALFRWLLRDQREAHFMSVIPAGSTPSMIITSPEIQPSNTQSYRGTAFVIGQEPSWSVMFFQEWLDWTLFRKAPLNQSAVVLWVQNEIFPNGGVLPESVSH